jgi:putative FmdB family regulatory protein
MPVYEFKCKSCGHTFEMVVPSVSQGICPKCNSKGLDEQRFNFSENSREDGDQNSKDTPPHSKIGPPLFPSPTYGPYSLN